MRVRQGSRCAEHDEYVEHGHDDGGGAVQVVVKRLAAVNLDTAKYSKYRVTTRLNARGRYRFRAYALTMEGWAPAQSKLSRVLAVK